MHANQGVACDSSAPWTAISRISDGTIMASTSSPDRAAKFRKLSPVKKDTGGGAGRFIAYFSDCAWNWKERRDDSTIQARLKGMGRYELIFLKETPNNLAAMIEAANNLSPYISCSHRNSPLAGHDGNFDRLTFYFFSIQGYQNVLKFLRDGGLGSLPDISWMNDFKSFHARQATFRVVSDGPLTIKVVALCATVNTPEGRGLASFLLGEPFNGVASGLDVKITAADKATYDEYVLDLQALAEEAGLTYAN